MEVTEYRVSSKVPGRILELRVKEGDYVKVGDTLAILDAPEIQAKAQQAQSAEAAAAALSAKAQHGARQQQIQGAYQLWQQAKAGTEIAKKSYDRVQRLFDEGVMTAQKRDEVLAQYKAMEAQEKAAKSQYDMAVEGARQEDKAPPRHRSTAPVVPWPKSAPICTRPFRPPRWKVKSPTSIPRSASS